MQALITIIHVLAAISIIVLVLLQHGKGADVGAAFGSGASNTMFGSAGSMSFFMKLTAALAAVFFITSLTLSYLASHRGAAPSIPLLNPGPVIPPAQAPAQPGPAAPAPK
jgi:preprotein translocase subunit SecG